MDFSRFLHGVRRLSRSIAQNDGGGGKPRKLEGLEIVNLEDEFYYFESFFLEPIII